MFRSALVAAAVIAGLVACGGASAPDASSSSGASGGGCTAIGCVDGLVLSFGSTTTWAPGAYVFTLNADGVEQTCKGALPLPPCSSGRGLSCTADIATIGESGCALPPSQHGFADIQVRSGPSKVTLRVERDGVVLAEETFVPTYQTSQPNGPNCGPVCRQASATVKLTAR